MASLEFKNLSKSFGKANIIDNLNLSISDGEMFVLLGPSGCGKSTILRLIAGLEVPDNGDIIIGNRVINNIPPKDRNVAMVFQNYALYPHMTIYDNLAFPLKVKKTAPDQIEKTVIKQAELLGLSDLLTRKPKTLSGGQRQRVALGRALVRNPEVFLFDEPLSNLDAKLRVSTRSEIARLQKKLDATMIYVTHDQEEALSLGHRIAILNGGILQQVGTPSEIYNQPSNVFCAQFVGNPKINLLDAMVSGTDELSVMSYIKLKLKTELNPKTELILGLRPENISFKKQHDDDISFQSEIIHVEFMGDINIVYGIIQETEIRVKSREMPEIVDGKAELYVRKSDFMIFDKQTNQRISLLIK
jgi:multiple sugar transport system ATP-binding protein